VADHLWTQHKHFSSIWLLILSTRFCIDSYKNRFHFPSLATYNKYENPVTLKNKSTIMLSFHYQKTIARLVLLFFMYYEFRDSTEYADTIWIATTTYRSPFLSILRSAHLIAYGLLLVSYHYVIIWDLCTSMVKSPLHLQFVSRLP